ncbi:MAG: ATP-dependent helicase HrpB [Bacteroidia bacterium]|nr:ATP-dependent helicase HrpB [Bacteroidia bacterium]
MFIPLPQTDLPIVDSITEIQQQLINHTTLIINAPPGAGKSTLLPIALINEPWLKNKKIILLEPRRLAAKTVAMRMASLLGEEVGETIGYRIRFEQKISNATRIEVVTEGILTRMLQHDNALEDVGAVFFDEFHERSIHADLALALCREAQQILRPDLRLIVMSATLNTMQLSTLLNAPVVTSLGKQYPVEIKYTGEADKMLLPELTARIVMQALYENKGDILVFLPGEAEIKKTSEILEKEVKSVCIHPLYGILAVNAQMAAIYPNKQGKRKIVLATSIAETSLTIENIKVVVDCGMSRVSKFDAKTGLSRLETVPVSKDSADQRAGRAGRLSEGVCYRMWTKATHTRLAEHRTPEIEEADLTGLVLELILWGIKDIYTLTWLTPPPKSSVNMALDTLAQLQAIEDEKITEQGKALHQLPCHPRIAHLLLKAKEDNEEALGCDLAAILEERDPLPKDSGIDINLRIELLRRNRAIGKIGNRIARIEKIAAQYRKMLNAEVDNEKFDAYKTGILLAYAYPERIACARTGNNAQFQLANGRIAVAGHRDDLANEAWLAVAHIDARDGLGKIFMAAPLNPKDLLPMVKEKQTIKWDSYKGGIIATNELRIGNIVLKSTPINNPDEKLIQSAIIQAIQNEGENLLNFDDKFLQLQARILSLKKWNPEQYWQDVSTPTLLQKAALWLGPFTTSVKRIDDLKRIDLYDALKASLDWEMQKQLEELAPEKIIVPSGSHITLQYTASGEVPILAVRLQEVFGLAETPKINNNKQHVVMHLLSPGFKLVQISTDLHSFWNNTYYEVKKELQRKYPKHAWPDEPWTTNAVSKGGIRKS